MKVAKKQLPKSQVQLDVSLEPAEFEKHRTAATAVLAKDMRMEGFRPGHVPIAVAEKQLGQGAILAKAARLAIGEAYAGILEEQQVDAIGEPEVHVLKLAPGNPLEFQIKVAVLPYIELPEYKEIAKATEKRKVEVREKEVQDALEWLKESRKTKDGVTLELDDDFAKTVGNFTDVASLKESIAEGLRHEKELREKERFRQEILEKIAEQARLDIPDMLVEREKQVLLQNVKQGVAQTMGIPFQQYLTQTGKTETELLDSFEQEAAKRVKRFLVLREVAKKEGITPGEEEIEEHANAIIRHYKDAGKAEKDIDPVRLKEYAEGVIRHEKTLQFLESLAV
ncbi:MAG TPA: trigger factor [Candidatus Paceibacterota bacterium]